MTTTWRSDNVIVALAVHRRRCGVGRVVSPFELAEATIETTNIHGFQVALHAPSSRGFERGLRRLKERGFVDPTCTVVKTRLWEGSALTHEGGRYVHPRNPFAEAVVEEMRLRDMEPPELPFLLAPGEMILYHEWGHHVDRCWAGPNDFLGFSFNWLLQFYRPGLRVGPRTPHRPPNDEMEIQLLAQLWTRAASETFADLFEDWMRDKKEPDWDRCKPDELHESAILEYSVGVDLVAGASPNAVRSQTCALFEAGLANRPMAPQRHEDSLDPFAGHAIASYEELIRSLALA